MSANLCPHCGTAELIRGREACQGCAVAAAIAAAPSVPVVVFHAPADLSGTHPCGYCGTNPCGPGGVLCTGCKDVLESRGPQRNEMRSV